MCDARIAVRRVQEVGGRHIAMDLHLPADEPEPAVRVVCDAATAGEVGRLMCDAAQWADDREAVRHRVASWQAIRDDLMASLEQWADDEVTAGLGAVGLKVRDGRLWVEVSGGCTALLPASSQDEARALMLSLAGARLMAQHTGDAWWEAVAGHVDGRLCAVLRSALP